MTKEDETPRYACSHHNRTSHHDSELTIAESWFKEPSGWARQFSALQDETTAKHGNDLDELTACGSLKRACARGDLVS